MENDIDKKLERLEQNQKLLINAYLSTRNELIKVKDENKLLRNLAVTQKTQIAELSHKNRLNQIAGLLAESTPEEKEALKRTIDEYVKEIDRCIAFLSQNL